MERVLSWLSQVVVVTLAVALGALVVYILMTTQNDVAKLGPGIRQWTMLFALTVGLITSGTVIVLLHR